MLIYIYFSMSQKTKTVPQFCSVFSVKAQKPKILCTLNTNHLIMLLASKAIDNSLLLKCGISNSCGGQQIYLFNGN